MDEFKSVRAINTDSISVCGSSSLNCRFFKKYRKSVTNPVEKTIRRVKALQTIRERRQRLLEDDKIVWLYLNRDETAIRQTSEKYGSRLRAISYKITSDRETSEECENDTYLETWNRIPPSDPRDYFYAFLAKITRALSIDRCRERTRLKRDSYIVELTSELEMCIPAVDDVAGDVEAKLLGEAISRYLYTLSDEKQV
ncbi:MAG: hypothetical protein MJ141_01625, partial [Clostridia bacterium]|nr:hypothetical protein [Clostridia bacterium]